ncbi:MAG TPA: triose-phosphate isomerase [Solirubrobacterales bacterium]|nr:triose-phosphate isomerase [Solirubrobacterales bacterium]
MSERTPVVAANWKMHKTIGEAEAFLDRFLGEIDSLAGVEIVVCPPAPALATAVERSRRSPVRIAAQNAHFESQGAFTGEISPPMLADLGAWGAVVGHSERRAMFGETDEALARKVPALLDAGLVPILCVGETEAERDAGETEAVLRRQVGADLAEVADERLGGIVIAYEPVWAIGTGRTATPDQAQEAIAFIRSLLADRDSGAAAQVRIQYGGSVKPANAAELMSQPDIDGALVGGASLDPEDFVAICAAAAASRSEAVGG